MKIHFSYIFCFLLIWILLSQPLYAIWVTQKWKILEQFKKREQELIFESDSLLDDEDKSILTTYKKLWLYSRLWEEVRSRREFLEEQKEKITGRVNSLKENIVQFNAEIAELVEEVDRINSEIVDIKKQIELNKKSIEFLQKKIEDNTEILLDYMVYLYKKWESVSSENDIDNIKTILISGENIDELVNDLHFKSVIQLTGQQLVEKHRGYVSRLYIKKLELEESQSELKALRRAGILQKKVLDDKKEAKEKLLDITKGQEDLYQKYIEEKLETERDLREKELTEEIALNNSRERLLGKHNCDFVDLKKESVASRGLSEKCLGINKIIHAEARLSSVERPENNPFDWPVTPYRWLSALFRDENYIRHLGTDHDAIDVPVPQGTEIKAPMDGYVIFIQPPVDPWYAYFAVKHPDGLVSLYGHVSEILVEKYDYVKKGDVIALSGGSVWTKGAGVLSTWAHLHFAVYENQTYQDPLEYLDISYLDYQKLSVRYQYKYLSDFKSRKGYEYESKNKKTKDGIFKIVGNNEVERQKYLLNTYAVWAFRNWDMWIEEAVDQDIDPTFAMCVGLAETTLWKYMKTPNNIGNVWNTDSGATITFSSPRAGLHSMVKAFNNQYLSQYDAIEDLSRYGNKNPDKPIYASSPFNWHNNITKCMSHVKWSFVPDNYNFRTE